MWLAKLCCMIVGHDIIVLKTWARKNWRGWPGVPLRMRKVRCRRCGAQRVDSF